MNINSIPKNKGFRNNYYPYPDIIYYGDTYIIYGYT